MSEKSKFCSNCGEKIANEEKFCPNCGFNFETREVPGNDENKQEETQTSSKQDIFNLKNIDFKKLNKKQLGIIGGAIVGLLLFIFLVTGNVSIAGTYESEETLGNPEEEMLLEISRNGKTDIIVNDYYEEISMKYTMYLEKSGENTYIADTSKGMDIEASGPATTSDYPTEIEALSMELGAFGFDVENTEDGVSISGSLTEIQAIDAGLDLRDVYIVEYGDNLMIDGEMLIKR